MYTDSLHRNNKKENFFPSFKKLSKLLKKYEVSITRTRKSCSYSTLPVAHWKTHPMKQSSIPFVPIVSKEIIEMLAHSATIV